MRWFLAIALAAQTPTSKVEAEAQARLSRIVPGWYQQETPLRCIQYCKTLAGSEFRYQARDTREQQEVIITVVCDDVPDQHQCGYLVRPL